MKNHVLLSLVVLFLASCGTSKKVAESESVFDLENSLLSNGYSKVLIKKLPSGHLTLSTIFNGIAGNFILDTGSSTSVVDRDQQEKFNMEALDTGERGLGAGSDSEITLLLSSNNNIKIGEVSIANQSVYLINLNHINDALEIMNITPVDGIIGADVLESRHVIIDYENLGFYLK